MGVEPPFRPNGCHYDKPKEKHMIKDVKTENVLVLKLFKYILDHKLLSPEEENELGILAMTGNLKARNKLVICNQKLVVKLALGMHKKNFYLDFEDLYSEGNIGLIKAAERFDSSKGARFATFASYYVMDAMQKYAKKRSKVLSLSLDETDLDAEPMLDSLCLEEVDFDKNLMLEELYKTLSKLPNREREVLMDKFGIFGRNKSTLQEIGEKLGLSKQRVNQIEKQALNSCRTLGITMA